MSESQSQKPSVASLGGVTPILSVRDLAASIAYYVNLLGFKVDFEGPGIFASVSRDRCAIFLCEGDQGHAGSWVWIGVNDVTALHEELKAKGAKIRQEPTNHPWALEIQVEDPDGHVLRFGSEPLQDQPFGDWLDMRGVLWRKSPDGGWLRIERA